MSVEIPRVVPVLFRTAHQHRIIENVFKWLWPFATLNEDHWAFNLLRDYAFSSLHTSSRASVSQRPRMEKAAVSEPGHGEPQKHPAINSDRVPSSRAPIWKRVKAKVCALLLPITNQVLSSLCYQCCSRISEFRLITAAIISHELGNWKISFFFFLLLATFKQRIVCNCFWWGALHRPIDFSERFRVVLS